MLIEELYPYWDDAHQDLLETLEYINEEQVVAKPHDGAKSIRDLVLALVYAERFFIANLAGDCDYEKPAAAVYADGPALIELLRTTREVSARVLEPLTASGLRAVRTLPADPQENRHETNVPIAWLFWHVMQQEIMCLGQVKLRIADEKSKKPGRWE